MVKIKEVYPYVGDEKAYFYGLGTNGQIYFWDAGAGEWIEHKFPAEKKVKHTHG